MIQGVVRRCGRQVGHGEVRRHRAVADRLGAVKSVRVDDRGHAGLSEHEVRAFVGVVDVDGT